MKVQKMNATEGKGNCNEQKGKPEQKFANIIDNDLMFAGYLYKSSLKIPNN